MDTENKGGGCDGVLEFGKNDNGNNNNNKNSVKHNSTDKHKRQQMSGKFDALLSLVPTPAKTDRATVVGTAIKYINELKGTVEELKHLVDRKRCNRGRMKKHKTEGDSTLDVESIYTMSNGVVGDTTHDQQAYNGNSSSTMRSSMVQRKSKHTEIDVRIIDDEVTIKLVQQKRINSLLLVSKVLDELQLDLHHVAGGLIGDFYSYLFNTKICEGSSVYATAIANKLIEVVDKQYAAIPLFTLPINITLADEYSLIEIREKEIHILLIVADYEVEKRRGIKNLDPWSPGLKLKQMSKGAFLDGMKEMPTYNSSFDSLLTYFLAAIKTDRATVVGTAIKYINELKGTVEELKHLVDRKRCNRGRMKKHKTEGDSTLDVESIYTMSNGVVGDTTHDQQAYNGNSSSTMRSSMVQTKSKHTEIDVRIIDDEVTIKLVQQKRINSLLLVSKVLDELQLDLHHVVWTYCR
ncbi:transcription factor bHLH91-like protein [Tanacetum coccineum]